jgi:hypothetical protein
MCDMGLGGGISEFFNQEVRSTSPDYNRWQSVIADIAAAPHCPGEGVPLEQAASGPFYAARNGLAGIFCRACYLGHFLATPLEGTVSETALSPEQLATIPCNAAGSFSQFALKQAIKQEDLALWSRAAVWNAKVPACSGVKGVDETEIQGVQGLSWYKLRDHPNIEVCPSCFHICLELFSLGGLFEPIDRPLVDGFVRQCFMPVNLETDNTSVEDINDFPTTIDWRAKLIREGILFYSASNGDPRVLKGYAEKIASLPPPCFSNSRICFPINRRKWFGRSAQLGDPDDFHFAMCEDCFVNCAKGTPLEHILNGDATAAVNTQEAGFVCQAYSNRTRKVLKEAMQSGNWESFAHHWKTREEVNGRYHAANREAIQMKKVLALKAQVDAEGAMGSIRLMQGLTANTNAIIMGIGGSVAEASATDYGQRYGNSTVRPLFL